ncbi:MAG TPA: adenylate/guanylate cyclase domain-containing protein [Acidimicrobiales bacterium]|nr:adenylate/guanylate cyclase domain-containing protein [Acidimicrobiales bacterium]
MPSIDRARARGEGAVEALRQRLNEHAAALINLHPEFARGAAEVGLIDRAWLEDPLNRPIRTATSLDVVQRFLERSVEQEPSLIANMGLNAIQLLTIDADADADAPRQVATIAFTDLEGFTRYTARHGDVAARELLERHHRAVGPVIRSRGGRIVKKIGDGLLVSFGVPEAAVLAAVEIAETNETGLRLRVGLHHGEVVALGDDLIGHDVNLAARVADSAKGGEILATVDVREAVGTVPAGVEFGRARRRTFKGVDGSVLVCPVRRAA